MQRMKVVLPEPDGADDDHDLLALDLQGDALQDVELAEPLVDVRAPPRPRPSSDAARRRSRRGDSPACVRRRSSAALPRSSRPRVPMRSRPKPVQPGPERLRLLDRGVLTSEPALDRALDRAPDRGQQQVVQRDAEERLERVERRRVDRLGVPEQVARPR